MAEFEKPSNTEDEYFAREDIEKKRKLALKYSHDLAETERQRLKDLHHMHCPKCGMQMQTVKEGPVEVDACFNCGGVFFDKGEIEALVQHKEGSHPVVDAILGWLSKPAK